MLNIIREAKVFKFMILELLLMLIQAYFIYQQTLAIQSLNLANMKDLITSLIYWIIGDKVFRCIGEYIQNMYIDIPISEKASSYFTSIEARADPEYVKGIKNNQAIIPDGMKVITTLSRESLSLIQPLVQVLSRFVAISSTIDTISIVYVFGGLISLLILGISILMYDYRKQKENHKKDITYQENKRSVLQGYLTYYVNGMMNYVSKQLSINVLNSVKMFNLHESKMSALYNFLETFENLLPLAITYAIANTNITLDPVAILYIVKSMFSNTWWLFWQLKHLIISTATWGTMEDFLAGYEELYIPNLVDNPSISDIMHILDKPGINEVRLYAESGGGKTTWMLNKVISLARRFHPGYWLYMEQHLSLPKDEMSIREFMSLRFPNPFDLPMSYEDTLLSYAEKLGISNLIRVGTLAKAFKRPSGGEVKRIMFLQFFLPIIMGLSKVKVAFLDEITAGLDPSSFEKVRRVIDDLKKEKAIKFITIDHHDYEVDQVLEVKKKEIQKINPLSIEKDGKERKSLWSYISSYIRFEDVSDDTESEDEENEEEKEIRVWIPFLGEEEPKY